ncbi:ABC transporter permease [Pseudomonas sp. GX19020]|uniref:ABC transporter permease n=1 Tax=Pseudomonas sp. GX19020 TaxID=2942277 RepID=UPI00201A1C07|nr:ABC transporter permease [Pseudomonas sp. GX19020]MCL4067777.1 ABC transporter permease [Pseudomonas sp. GX19020]
MTDQPNPGMVPLTKTPELHESGDFRLRFQSLRVILALLVREMITTFGRSRLGYLWAVLEPVGGIVVLTLGFSILFKQPPVGTSFSLFYATGFIPFACYTNSYAQIATALKANRMLLFYPAVTFMDVIFARLILLIMTQFTVAFLVFTGIVLLEDTGSQIDFGRAVGSLLMAVGIGTGIGLINAVLFEMAPSWQNLWSILNRPIFFLSCVFYSFDAMPEQVQVFLWWNPLVHVVGEMRMAFYPEYQGDYLSPLYVVCLMMLLITIGLLNMRAMRKFIMNN